MDRNILTENNRGMIDLHMHSTASDGTTKPGELVRYAYSKGVSVMALTDHDSVAGCGEAEQAAKEIAREGGTIRFINGIEISADFEKQDIHILGLNINPKNETLCGLINEAAESRDRRNREMVKRFCDANMPMTIEALTYGEKNTTITRAHMARYLRENGYVRSNAEAFDRYLGYDKPFYVRREYVSPKRAIETILEAGGLPVLAHPLLYSLSERRIRELIAELKGYGLMGLEVYYSANVNNDEAFASSLAREFDLYMSGGSDYHGANKTQIDVGIGRGWLKVPWDKVGRLPFLTSD